MKSEAAVGSAELGSIEFSLLGQMQVGDSLSYEHRLSGYKLCVSDPADGSEPRVESLEFYLSKPASSTLQDPAAPLENANCNTEAFQGEISLLEIQYNEEGVHKVAFADESRIWEFGPDIQDAQTDLIEFGES